LRDRKSRRKGTSVKGTRPEVDDDSAIAVTASEFNCSDLLEMLTVYLFLSTQHPLLLRAVNSISSRSGLLQTTTPLTKCKLNY
jgi:hypothetical protein